MGTFSLPFFTWEGPSDETGKIPQNDTHAGGRKKWNKDQNQALLPWMQCMNSI